MRRSGAVDPIKDVLRQAGYSLESAQALDQGMLAYAFTTYLLAGARHAGAMKRGRGKTGRNKPCPCGSGKKYKKCCLSRDKAERAGRTVKPDNAAVDPRTIPNLCDIESVRADLERLGDLLLTDEELKRIRFSRPDVTLFLQRSLEEAGVTPDGPGPTPEQIDRIASRYARQHGGVEVARRLLDTIEGAVRRIDSPEDLRSLSLGAILAQMYDESDQGADLLMALLFRMSVGEHVRSVQTIERVVEDLGGFDQLRSRMESSDPQLRAAFRDLSQQLETSEIDDLRRRFDEEVSAVDQAIRDGRFPVLLPLVSILPLIRSFDLTLIRQKGDLSPEQFVELAAGAAEDLGPEDWQLYGWFLQRWLDENQGTDEEVESMVRFVRGLMQSESQFLIDVTLLSASVLGAGPSCFEEEEELVAAVKDDPEARAEHLLGYAGLLQRKGYPALAERVERLSEEERRTAS